jgi:ribonuclease R
MKEKLLNKIVDFINSDDYKPMTFDEISVALNLLDEYTTEEVMEVVREMDAGVYHLLNKSGKVYSPLSLNTHVGVFIAHKKGFGFVKYDKEGVQDLFIPSKNVNHAMHGDRVIAEITQEASGYKRREGNIVTVVKRNTHQVVGKLEKHENFGFVIPREKSVGDVFIPKKFLNDAEDGEIVVVEITCFPYRDKKAEGRIVEVLGSDDDRGIEIESIIREHGLPLEFNQKVLDNADFVAIPIPKEELERRRDLRDEMIFTIDGADAKDLDDAISIKPLDNGNYKLGVHIADVTHYVKEKSNLDKEALKRATSVYLVDKVIPMLPKQLSNGVCSLNPNEDKLALSIEMEIDSKGNVVSHEIFESVIRSKARMTYTEVSDILEENDRGLKIKYAELVDDFRYAENLARILMKKRDKRGALDFDFPEAYIHLDENGRPYNIEPYERRIANRIIEEFMLVSNETIAEQFYWLGIPFVYRIHETPSSTKIEALNKFINTYGLLIKGDTEEVHPKAVQKIIKGITGKPGEKAIHTLILRSLKQAKYSPECSGHFGLSAKYYCHFTSPIRRYPDLQIHRIIKEFLNGKLSSRRQDKLGGIVDNASEQSSIMERKAEVAERDIHKFYKCVYMEDKIGQEFEGMISSVTNYGFYVELPDTVEGLVPLEELNDDFYIFNESNLEMVGKGDPGRVFKIGDMVKVKLERVNVEAREITFSIL